MIAILSVSTAILACIIAYLFMGYRRLTKDNQRINMVMHNLTSYAFLIDKNLEVKETNYYAMNPTQQKSESKVLGNVLHCSTACEEGVCGTGLACKNCPVRFVITKSFEHKSDFNDLEVSMEIHDDQKKKATDVDVNIGGRYVDLGGEPHMVLNVKDVSESRRLLRRYIDQQLAEETDPDVPKILVATQDVARFNHLRELLQDTCRTIYVDTAGQVLNRIGKTKDYGYSAVLFDETFIHEHDLIDQLNEHIVVILLTNDGEVSLQGRKITLPQTVADEELKNLIAHHFGKQIQ